MPPSSTTMRRPPSPPLIPPFRFACVESGVYRGAHPSLKNFRYLTRLNLRTIISLIPDISSPSSDLSSFCASRRITHFKHTVLKYDDGFSHTPELVSVILAQLLDPVNHPVFLHCLDGRQNTGLVIMCLRKLQNWGLPAILNEFARYTKGNTFAFEEQQFVQTFNAPVQLPYSVPEWFANRVRFGSIDLPLNVNRTESPSANTSRIEQWPDRTGRDAHTRHAQALAVYSSRLDALNVDGVQLRRRDPPGT